MSRHQAVPDKDRRHHIWALVAILLLAFALRLVRLGSQSLWYDETVSVHLASKSLPALVAHTAGDIHPPGYYVLLQSWTRLAGASDYAVAFPSLLFGMMLVAMACWLGARVFGRRAGLLAALLVAVSPFNLWYSQEVRMYTLGAVLGMGLLGVVIPMLTVPRGARPAWRHVAVYAILGALGLWALYYFAFLLVALNLMVLGWWLVSWRRGRMGWGWLGGWVLAQVGVLLLYAPWLPIAWRQATNPPVPPWRSVTWAGDLWVQTWSALGLGQSVEPGRVWPVLLLFVLLFCLGLFGARSLRRDPEHDGRPAGRGEASLPWLLAGYVLLPVLLIQVASIATPLYHVRYVFTYSTPFYVLAGAGLAWLGRRWRAVAWIALAVILVFSGLSIYAYHTDAAYASDDHRAATQFLRERWRPGDAILVNAGYAYTALLTYWDDGPIAWRGRLDGDWPLDAAGPVVVQTGTVGGDPSLGWGDPDSDFYALSEAETEAALARLTSDFHRVWVYRIYDTVTDPLGLIREFLEAEGVRFEDQTFSGESQLRVQGFLTGRDPQADAGHFTESGLPEDPLRLVAAEDWPLQVEAGAPLDLALVWQVGVGVDPEAVLFAGLFDEEGRRWAQADERPLGSFYGPGDWPEGSAIRTPLRVQVPASTPPGRYGLEVGWYRFADGQPVWLSWTPGERRSLGEVEVLVARDWEALPPPNVAYPLGVTLGDGVELVGFEAPALEGKPGDTLHLDLFWRALTEGPDAGVAVLQLRDGDGTVVFEASAAPADGRAPFAGLEAGQVVRDPRTLALPPELEPGVYSLTVGRRQGDGTWLPVRRGPLALGTTQSLATVRVLGRAVNLDPPQVGVPADVHFGEYARFVGHDLDVGPSRLELGLHWLALAPTSNRVKIFLHLVGDGGPSDIHAQADLYPRLPSTGWLAGEYLSDEVAVDLPADLPPGAHTLLLGLYDEETGERLPVYDAAGETVGDSWPLQNLQLAP